VQESSKTGADDDDEALRRLRNARRISNTTDGSIRAMLTDVTEALVGCDDDDGRPLHPLYPKNPSNSRSHRSSAAVEADVADVGFSSRFRSGATADNVALQTSATTKACGSGVFITPEHAAEFRKRRPEARSQSDSSSVGRSAG
jgi:hypothetical protein